MWNSEINFEHVEWVPAISFGGFLLLVVFLWKEWKGVHNRSFYINSFIGFISILSLGLLMLSPTMMKEVKGEAVLLTAGYAEEQLDSLYKSNGRLTTINYTPGMDLLTQLDSVNQLLVMGYGIKDYDLWQLERQQVEFIPTEISEGIVKLDFTQNAMVGEDWTVEGLYRNPREKTKLVLQGPGREDLDSVLLTERSSQNFSLKANLKVKGKFVYKLQIKDSTGIVIENESLPLVVEAKKVLKILLVNEFPSFEAKYLKNFLAEQGHEVVVKTKLTVQKYKFEYFNTDKVAIYALNTDSLNEFDLIVFDDKSLNNLSRSEQSILAKSVLENGMGVFVQQTEDSFQGKNALVEFETIRDNQTTLQLTNWPKNTLEKFPVQYSDTGLLGIPIGNFAFSIKKGKGQYGSTILKNTYQLILDGNEFQYREIWSRIITEISRKSEPSGFLKSSNDLAYLNEPYDFSFFTKDSSPMIVYKELYQLPLIKDAVMVDEWHGTTYPKKMGWHSLVSEKDSSIYSNFYIMDGKEWNTLVNARTLRSNKRFFSLSNSKPVIKKIPQILDRIWFFMVFLLGMTYLWLETKLRNL